MATQVWTRPVNNDFLGNTNHMEVHDLRNETGSCQVQEVISAGHAVTFSPDTLAQALSEGFDNCNFCIGASQR